MQLKCVPAGNWQPLNVNLGNGLALLSNKPLPEPMSTKFQDNVWGHKATMGWYIIGNQLPSVAL